MKTFKRLSHLLACLSACISSFACTHVGEAQSNWGLRPSASFRDVINSVTGMPRNHDLQRRARERGLNVVNVMWEDTARSANSSMGPNISDLTLQVREPIGRGRFRTHLLPVIRYPNFTDRTADIPADEIWVRVGNHEDSDDLGTVPLNEVISNLRSVLSDSGSLLGSDDLSAPRDTHYLVSAQHVFMPLPRRGQAEFSPVLFNYQSSPRNPAVAVLMISRQGTSATIIENRPGDQGFQRAGQQLFHNNEGQRTFFTAERRSAVRDRIESGRARRQDQGALEEGADMVMIVQIPLVHRAARRGGSFGITGSLGMSAPPQAMPMEAESSASSRSRSAASSDVENAVIGHGEDLGRFHEMRRQRLVRDTRFPVRITVQFYRATSNGVISNGDLREVHEQIERVYEDGDFVGSLVVPRGQRVRPTDWLRHRRPQARRPIPRPRRWGRWHRRAPDEVVQVGPYVF